MFFNNAVPAAEVENILYMVNWKGLVTILVQVYDRWN
jgi:hypothetical protein